MADFNYRQETSIPRIVFGCGLARNIDHAINLTEHSMVQVDGKNIDDRNHVLDVGEHTVTVIEHKEEVMTQAKTPPSKQNPKGTEEKWEWVVVGKKSARFNVIYIPPEEDAE